MKKENDLQILRAAVPLFAHYGFHGTQMADIAKAAGVTETALYQQFQNKASLFQELKRYCCESCVLIPEVGEPSTKLLVESVQFLLQQFALRKQVRGEQISGENLHRLLTTSFVHNGALSQDLAEGGAMVWESVLEASVKAAISAGDLQPSWLEAQGCWWLAYHLSLTLNMVNPPAHDQASQGFDRLLDQATLFTLRGIGLSDHAIMTYVKPATDQMVPTYQRLAS